MRNNPNEFVSLLSLHSIVAAALLSTGVATMACADVSAGQNPPATQTAQPAIDEWGDDFDGDRLDEAKWEPYTEVGLESTIRGVSPNFKVMLYGFGNSENNWDSIGVQTLKQ